MMNEDTFLEATPAFKRGQTLCGCNDFKEAENSDKDYTLKV